MVSHGMGMFYLQDGGHFLEQFILKLLPIIRMHGDDASSIGNYMVQKGSSHYRGSLPNDGDSCQEFAKQVYTCQAISLIVAAGWKWTY